MWELPNREPVPLTILSGFLGAGKTTLLNRILRGDHGLRVGVIVNDFGAINIDAELVVGVDDGMVSLSNGCVCCSLRDDLIVSARALRQRVPPPEYVVIETSGVSDPFAVGLAFRMPPLPELFRLDSIVTVVDTEQLPVLCTHTRLRALMERQIDAADLVVLNKIDLVSAAERGRLRSVIETRAPRVLIWETSDAKVPLPLLLDTGRSDVLLDDTAQHDHAHAKPEETFYSWSWQTDRPLLLDAVQRLLTSLPPHIIRAKGVLSLAELPDKRAIMHVVGRRVTIVPGAPWGATRPSTQLVLIGAPGGVPAAELEQSFRSCVADSAEA